MSGLPPDLPICTLEGELKAALLRGRVVVTSPTGSGKSTWIPVWAADRLGRVLVVEPRRVACRSLARFVARSLDVSLGKEVGYAVRYDDRIGDDTRIAYVTPGVALRMMLDDTLDADRVVLLDEFHQRGLQTDLILAVLMSRQHRCLGILSATLDGERVARHIDGALIESAGRAHPVSVRYIGQDPVPTARGLPERVVAALAELAGQQGDVLVFLPGKGEIAACHSALQRHPEYQPIGLHAELPHQQQDQAFEPSERRRAILSTNVAETSVTMPWVRSVIDSGLVRRTIYREGRGALALTSIAMDAAEQRAGRAGRLGPGICLRLWSRTGKLEPRTSPEILREDLSQLVLHASQLGYNIDKLPWLDPPKAYAVTEARDLLGTLGLMESSGALTAVGAEVGRLPVDPVLGRLLESGRQHDVLADMILLVAVLSLGRPMFLPGEPSLPQGSEPDPLTESRCDATALILCLRAPELARSRVRHDALSEAQRIARQLFRLMGTKPAEGSLQRDRLAEAIYAALPHSPFARRPRRNAWGNGTLEAELANESLIEQGAQTILVVDQRLIAQRGQRIKRIATCCMPVAPHRLRRWGAGYTRATSARIKKDVLVARLQWFIGTTLLESTDDVPRGAAARKALVDLLLGGTLYVRAMDAARDEVEAYNLHRVMEGASSDVLAFNDWLERRLETLGFDSGEDLPLLNEKDLAPGLLTDGEREQIDRRFPRNLSIGDLHLKVDYDPTSCRITLRAAQAGRPPPREDFLPRWPGWSVAYHDGKHTVMLRKERI